MWRQAEPALARSLLRMSLKKFASGRRRRGKGGAEGGEEEEEGESSERESERASERARWPPASSSCSSPLLFLACYFLPFHAPNVTLESKLPWVYLPRILEAKKAASADYYLQSIH